MDSGIAGEPKLLAQAHLVTTPEPDIPAAAGNPKYTTHRFDAELCPMIFDEDILHFRRFAKLSRPLEDGQFLSLLRQLSFKADIFSGQFAFAL